MATERTPVQTRGVTPQTPAAPVGTDVGDWVVIVAQIRGGTAAVCATPAGWTAAAGSPFTSAGATAASDIAEFVFLRRWDGVWSMPAIAWSGDGGNNANFQVRAFVGFDVSTPLDVAIVATAGAGVANSSAILTGLTTVTDAAYVWHSFAINAAPTAMTVPDTTDLIRTNNPGGGSGHAGAQSPAGPTGTKTYSWTGGSNTNWVGIVVAMRPLPAPVAVQLAANLQGVATVPTADLRARRGVAATLQGVATLSADLKVTPAGGGGRGPEDYETDVGPRAQVAAMIRRASLYVTVTDFPPTVLVPPASVMHASIYVGRGGSSPPIAQLYRQIDAPSKTTRLDDFNPAGANPPSPGNFPTGVPATLATETGEPLIRSNGMPRVKAQNNALQSIPNDVFTAVVFANEIADTDDAFDPATPSVFQLPFGGQWQLSARIAFQQGSAIGYRQAILQTSSDGGANWTGTAVQARVAAAPGTGTDVILAGLVDVSAGRMQRIAARHTDGAPLNVGQTSYVAFIYMGPT